MLGSLFTFLVTLLEVARLVLRHLERAEVKKAGKALQDAQLLKKVKLANNARVLVNNDVEYARLLARELGIEKQSDNLGKQLLSPVQADLPEPAGHEGNPLSDTGELRNIQGVVYRYSKTSLRRLQTCESDLQRLFLELSKHHDISIICGHRDRQAQNEAFYSGHSKLKFPKSKHNSMPSQAVDAVPVEAPKMWAVGKDLPAQVYYDFAQDVFRVANELGINNLRWGGDWDGDKDYTDQTFNDLAHWELI